MQCVVCQRYHDLHGSAECTLSYAKRFGESFLRIEAINMLKIVRFAVSECSQVCNYIAGLSLPQHQWLLANTECINIPARYQHLQGQTSQAGAESVQQIVNNGLHERE